MKTNQLNKDKFTPVYDSASRVHPVLEELSALYRYRELILQFVSRSIKTRYKRSILGVLWTMLNPILTMIVLSLVFSQLFRFSVQNYPIYVLTGLVVWSFFSTSTTSAMSEMLWSGSLLTRIYVPKSVFAVSAIGTALVNLLISLIPLLIISLFLGVQLTPALLVIPLSVFLLVMFALGVGLLLSTVAIFFADIIPVYEVILVIWMYATPIIYPPEIIPERFTWLLKLNPLYYLVTLFREPIYQGTIPELEIWVVAALFSVAVLVIGGLVFSTKVDEYAYHI